MFDIGWSEVLVVAVVAVIVVGPKELPRMLRTFGKTMGTVRRTANDFKRQFDQALRGAEREADLEDTRKQLQSLTKLDSAPAAKATPPATGAPPPAPTVQPSPPVQPPTSEAVQAPAAPQNGANAA